MATNATEEVDEETLDTTEDDLRKAKEDSETNSVTEELTPSEEDAQSEESLVKEEASAEPDTTLTTEPQEPEHDLAWYKKAYDESTKEAMRLKGLADKIPAPPATPVPEGTFTPEQLYIKQKQDEEIATAFAEITKNYSQVTDPEEYKKFTSMANTFGKTILDAEGRLATPAELYSKTVIALGWTDDSKEKLGAALKDGAGSPRISSGAGQSGQTSKVTDAMIAANRKMYPGKSDTEIREELEPYIQ